MKTISILGTGCPKCKKLYQNVEEAVSGNADYKIEKNNRYYEDNEI